MYINCLGWGFSIKLIWHKIKPVLYFKIKVTPETGFMQETCQSNKYWHGNVMGSRLLGCHILLLIPGT